MSEGMMRDAQRLAGLVFDRARLAILAHQGLDDSEYKAWDKQLPELCDLVLKAGSTMIATPKVRAPKKSKRAVRKA